MKDVQEITLRLSRHMVKAMEELEIDPSEEFTTYLEEGSINDVLVSRVRELSRSEEGAS